MNRALPPVDPADAADRADRRLARLAGRLRSDALAGGGDDDTAAMLLAAALLATLRRKDPGADVGAAAASLTAGAELLARIAVPNDRSPAA